MGGEIQQHQSGTKLILTIELVIIYINFLLIFIVFLYIIKSNEIYQLNIKKSFLYEIENRIIRDSFLTNLKLFPNPKLDFNCPPNYNSVNFFKLQNLKNADLKDETETIKIIDFLAYKDIDNVEKEMSLVKPKLDNVNYFTFDLNNKGNSSISFLNIYEFFSWKRYAFCRLSIKLDEDNQGFQLININKLCSQIDALDDEEKKNVLDCGIYENYYRLCVIKTHMKFNVRDSNKNLTDLNDIDYCPVMDLDIKFINNPKFNQSNPLSMKEIPVYSILKNNSVYVYQYNDINSRVEFLGLNIKDNINLNVALLNSRNMPKNLFADIEDFISFENYYDLANDTNIISNDFVYSDKDNFNILSIGEKFGFRDSFTKVFDKGNFYDFYNSSNFIGLVYFNSTNNLNMTTLNFTDLPFAMQNSEKDSFYLPFKNNGNKSNLLINGYNYENIFLSKFKYPTFKKDCFKTVFDFYSRPDFMRFLKEISIGFFDEILPTLIAWSFSIIFIYVWSFIKIRAAIIMDILKFRVMESDLKSEKVTKFTYKFFLWVSFTILLKGFFFQKSFFDKMISNTKMLKNYNCYSDDIIKYYDFLMTIVDNFQSYFNFARAILFIIIGFEFVVIILYFLTINLNYKPIKINEGEALIQQSSF